MVMNEESFSIHEEKEGWSDADEEISEDHEPSLSFGIYKHTLYTF